LPVKVEIGLQGRGALFGEPLDAAPNPAESPVLDHRDSLREGLSAIGEGGIDADTVEEIGRRNGRRHGGRAPPDRQDDVVEDLFIKVLGAKKNELAERGRSSRR